MSAVHPGRAREIVAAKAAALAGAAVDAGLRPYRPLDVSRDNWRRSYGSGDLDYYGRLNELGRYAMLLSYVQFFGEDPDVLDVGCGVGLLRERLPDGAFRRYIGLDPTPAAIDAARSRGFADSTFTVGDPATADLPDLDIIICNEVLYYMQPDPRPFLDRAAALLRPGGKLLTSVWRHRGDRALWRMIDSRFDVIDRVSVHNGANERAPRGWIVACHQRR